MHDLRCLTPTPKVSGSNTNSELSLKLSIKDGNSDPPSVLPSLFLSSLLSYYSSFSKNKFLFHSSLSFVTHTEVRPCPKWYTLCALVVLMSIIEHSFIVSLTEITYTVQCLVTVITWQRFTSESYRHAAIRINATKPIVSLRVVDYLVEIRKQLN